MNAQLARAVEAAYLELDLLDVGAASPGHDTHVVLRRLLDALTTPPDDDVREALADSRKVRQRYAERGLKRGGWKEEVRPHGTFTDADAKEEAVALAYNEVTGADGDEWSPDRTLAALNALWDAAKGVRS